MASEQLIAFVLGIVEGITEFLPISSTAHLVLAGKLFSFEGAKAATFEIFIQLGAILAVVVLYFPRFKRLLLLNDPSGFSGISGLTKLALACFPACVAGLVFHDAIKAHLFAPTPIAGAFIVGGLVMIFLERNLPQSRIMGIEDISYKTSLLAGVFQCLALWPGVSRSGSMIVGGLILGLTRVVAAEFSFLVAVPMMALACSYDLYKSRALLSAADVPLFAIGFVVSFVTAVLAIRFFIGLLKRFTLVPFGYYRIALGIAVLMFM